MYKKWLLEARDYKKDEPLCFCPYENEEIIIGINFLGNLPPGEFIGIFHQNGEEDCKKWCDENKKLIEKLKKGKSDMRERKYKIEDNKLVRRSDGVPVPEDEPLFILRAQDRNALSTIMAYHMICGNIQHQAFIKKSIDDFADFRNRFPERMKEPD